MRGEKMILEFETNSHFIIQINGKLTYPFFQKTNFALKSKRITFKRLAIRWREWMNEIVQNTGVKKQQTKQLINII